MKRIKNFTLGILGATVLSFGLYACSNDDRSEDVTTEQNVMAARENKNDIRSLFFTENIAIVDARAKTLDKNSFVRELLLINFSDEDWETNSIGLEDMLYQDNGEGFDEVANDGVFTSVEKFEFNNKVKYLDGVKILSVSENIVISKNFKHLDKLNRYYDEYYKSTSSNSSFKSIVGGLKPNIECDIEICSTGCLADKIWSGFGCICLSNCKASIGWG